MKILTDFDFSQELENSHLAVIEFFSPACAHCQGLAVVLEGLEEKHHEQVLFAKVDITQSPSTAARYNILSVPTLLFMEAGTMKDKIIGMTFAEIIEEKIKKLV